MNMALKITTTDQASDFQLGKYKGLFNSLLEGQNEIAENVKTDLMQELLSTFETAVRENIIVDGCSNDEVRHEDGERITLDDILDEKIVETTRKRSCYPKKIIPFVVRSLKAERKLMEMYEHTADTEELEREAFQDHIMKNVSEGVPKRFRQVTAVMKSLQEVCVRAEGLHQVLTLQPSVKSLEIYREVVDRYREENS
ncbi:kinetochore-associated protein NSL1 homolog [Alosa sapidissima]|uniref:kinetochore-associated protein NSL1 homolog n=1 Tax=Alosa sapidissima TaxID=34773 RepID=UPI001C07F977|nr:kinetochore-associated protein NSL1 homolog [Alosa sapidissima]